MQQSEKPHVTVGIHTLTPGRSHCAWRTHPRTLRERMHIMRKIDPRKIIAVLVATFIAIGSLAACGTATSKPKTASEVYAAYLKTDHDNSVVTGDMTLTAGVGALQLSLDTTLDLQLNGGAAHGTIAAKSGGSSMELYSVEQDGKRLVYYKGIPIDLSALGLDLSGLTNDQWYVAESDAADVNANIADAASVLDESIFIEAAFEENDGTYTVTINGASLAKRVAAALATENDTAETIASREELVNNILKDANVVLTFDDSCRLTSVYMAPVTASVPVDASLATNLDVTMGLDLKVSGYRTVGAIEVPAEVVSAAVSTEETPIPALGNAA